jgi:hypothetical protein
MPELYQWTGRRLIRSDAAIEDELELRQQTFAKCSNTPGWMLIALREYHQWLTVQWDGCHAERYWKNCPPTTLYKPIETSTNLSGDERDLNWVAFITGGAMALTDICKYGCSSAAEMATAHYLRDISFDAERAFDLYLSMGVFTRQQFRNRNLSRTPQNGLLGMGFRHFRWWLTRQAECAIPDNLYAAQSVCFLDQIVSSADTIEADIQKVPANDITRREHKEIPAFLKRNAEQRLADARNRVHNDPEPPSFIDLIKADNVVFA